MTNRENDRPTPRLHYAWVVAALTFLVLLATAGVRSAPGVLIVPLEREFGWSRATISSAVSVNLILYGLIGPFAAALMDRLGVRRTMVGALVVVAAGVALTTRMSAPWQLVLLWGVVVTRFGARAAFFGVIDGDAPAARQWADRHRSPYPVLADSDLRIIRGCGVERSAYVGLVARGGTIERLWPGYSAAMLAELKERLARLTGLPLPPPDTGGAPRVLASGCAF